MREQSSLSLPVEIITGTDIETAAKDLCALSKRLGIMVTSDFNGCYLIATESTSPDSLEFDYQQHRIYQSDEKRKK